MPWIGEFGDHPLDFGPGGFNGAPPGHGRELPAEFSMKILCSTGKIGKGSSNFKAVVQEAGASIHVEDASAKLAGILGQGGQDINEMRRSQADIRVYPKNEKPKCASEDDKLVQDFNEMRRLQADIRVYPKNEKPKCESEDDELVQISGNYGVATDVLDIASRLGARTLHDENAGVELECAGPVLGFSLAHNLPGIGPPPSLMMGASSSGGYEPLKSGRCDHEPQELSSSSSCYEGDPDMNHVLEANITHIMEAVMFEVKTRCLHTDTQT
ncbi:RNA-BINDING KH DOMAIN-CONTAINING PROTEIN [Salix koriyanagi]|uniref:RNA-BINDING KH DOMAIN-CONTAINING PROTEIN n=1 Tax=Salix koriyanagi TaxID=2511006 RepID=A0A9Q0UZ99_9ROSI|nr:RNA-BINDING KH DOMAIN-CONTAINING PROTEIN [Salix koriyanagi]